MRFDFYIIIDWIRDNITEINYVATKKPETQVKQPISRLTI